LSDFYSGSKTTTVTVTDPNLIRELQRYREENAQLMVKFNELSEQIERQRISSYEDLQRVDQRAAETLVKLASTTKAYELGGRTFGFFGLTSTGKSTMINKLIGFDLAETGVGETTKEIQPYDGQGYRLFDIPGRNDDISYFSMEYIAFWKGLTGRLVLITATIKEMTKVFRLLEAINLRYDIVVNKFDLVPIEERQQFKDQIHKEIRECDLQGVDHVWYVSAINPKQFPHWLVMVDSLTTQPENVSDDFDPIEYVVYE
jgi:GTP-binding protein EngB required for normal cell division